MKSHIVEQSHIGSF